LFRPDLGVGSANEWGCSNHEGRTDGAKEVTGTSEMVNYIMYIHSKM
jgi:hypothetical protein